MQGLAEVEEGGRGKLKSSSRPHAFSTKPWPPAPLSDLFSSKLGPSLSRLQSTWHTQGEVPWEGQSLLAERPAPPGLLRGPLPGRTKPIPPRPRPQVMEPAHQGNAGQRQERFSLAGWGGGAPLRWRNRSHSPSAKGDPWV